MAALSSEEIAAINAEHATIIKKLCQDEIDRHARELLGEDATVQEAQPAQISNLLHFEPECSRKELSIGEVMAGYDVEHNKVLQMPDYVEEESNRSLAFAKHFHANIDEMLKHIPVRCRDFYYLAEQRLSMLAMTTRLPCNTYTKLRISGDAMYNVSFNGGRRKGFVHQQNLTAHKLSVVKLNLNPTGSGKTTGAAVAALSSIVDDGKWEEFQKSSLDLLSERTVDPHTGLCEGEAPHMVKLARLVICLVNSTTIGQWEKEVRSVSHGLRDLNPDHQLKIWRDGVTTHSIQDAYDLRDEQDRSVPVFWILPMRVESLKVLRDHPNYSYAALVLDEMIQPMAARSKQPESKALFNYMVTRMFAQIGEFKLSHAPFPCSIRSRPPWACSRRRRSGSPATRGAWPWAGRIFCPCPRFPSWRAPAAGRRFRRRLSKCARFGSLRPRTLCAGRWATRCSGSCRARSSCKSCTSARARWPDTWRACKGAIRTRWCARRSPTLPSPFWKTTIR